MPRLTDQLWLVSQGDTWSSIAGKVGVSRNALVLANDQPTSTSTQPRVGRVLLVPKAGVT